MAEYEALLVEDPGDDRALFVLVDVFLKMKRYPDAITACERLADRSRHRCFYTRAVFYYVTGYAFFRQYAPHLEERFGHLPSRLAETFAEIVAESPQFVEQNAHFLQHALATRAGLEETEHALIELLHKVIAIDPSNPLPYHCLVDALVRAGDDDEAARQRGAVAEFFGMQVLTAAEIRANVFLAS